LNLLQNIVVKAVNDYKAIWKKEVGEESQVEVSVETEKFLPPSYVGGVVLTARQNKIMLDNTLAARLEICQDALSPIVRGRLFGVVEHVGIITKEKNEHEEQKHDH